MPEVIVRKGEPVDRALKRLKNKLDAEAFSMRSAVCALSRRLRKNIAARRERTPSAAE